jgi:hypothetical protein
MAFLSFLVTLMKFLPGAAKAVKALEGFINEKVAKSRHRSKNQSVNDAILRVQSRKAGEQRKTDPKK